MRGGTHGVWELVGRDEELRQLERLIGDAKCRGAVLAGPAGAGKSRLAVEGLERADARGFVTERVMATGATTAIPFGAVAVLLPEVTDVGGLPLRDQAGLIARTATVLRERSAGRRMVLLVDDAHLLDDASAALVHQLAATNSAFVLATLRTGEPAPDPVLALWKDELLFRLEVGPLSDAAIEELLERRLGGPVAGSVTEALTRRCEGNMLFLRELVLGALDEGILREDRGIWHLTGPLPVSNRLIEVVESRMRSLDPPARALLETMAFGEPLGPAELAALADEDVVDRLERSAFLATRVIGRRTVTSLGHPLYGDVLKQTVTETQARLIARKLAQAVETTGAHRQDDPLRIANWRLLCGGGSPEMMLSAATVARSRFDAPLAERLATAALESGAGFKAKALIAQLAAEQGRRDEAREQLRALLAEAQTEAEYAGVAIAAFDNDLCSQREHMLRICEDALEVLTEPGFRAVFTVRRAWSLLDTTGPWRAVEATEEAFRDYEGPTLVATCQCRTIALARMGRVAEALEVNDVGAARHRDLSEPYGWPPAVHVFLRCEALGAAGRFHDREGLVSAEYRRAVADRADPFTQGLLASQLATTLVDRGRVRSAARYAREAVIVLTEIEEVYHGTSSMLYLAVACALSGDGAGATEAMRSFEAAAHTATRELGGRFYSQAWTHVANGDLRSGRRLFEEEAALGERNGDFVRAVLSLHGLVRIGHADLAVDRLQTLAAQMEGDLAGICAGHAAGIVARDVDALVDVSARFEEMGADLLAAEAAADAAVALRRAGNPRLAKAYEHRAMALVDQCEGAATPALQESESRSRISAGERETAMLAAQGRSNKEIAGLLCVSVRTVEARLQHVYTKLGITRRQDLQESLEGVPPTAG